VGSLEETGLQKALDFYRSIISAEIKPMRSLKEAEAVKVVENAFRDVNIAFVNELAMSFSRLGIDVVNVIEGAATKPFAFMPHFPGCGVGGHCIPVDPYYLIDYAKKNGFDHDFLSLARRINSNMPRVTVELLAAALDEKGLSLRGSKVAVLGLAYKPEIDDCRESPSFEIIKELEERGAIVASYDPYVRSKSTDSSVNDALEHAVGAVIATAHGVFKGLTPQLFLQHNISVVVDGRNCLPKETFTASGIIYRGIGR
jgi:nucleotide sugar dehydrogenase